MPCVLNDITLDPNKFLISGYVAETLLSYVSSQINCKLKKLLNSMLAGKVILEAFVLTGVLVVSLTLYTFWAAKRGHDFNFLGPFLFGAVIVLMLFAVIQVCRLLSCSISCLLI